MRIYGHGNSDNDWNSYEEVAFTSNETCETLNNEDFILANDLELTLTKTDTSLTVSSTKKNLNTLKLYDLTGQVLISQTKTNAQIILLNTSEYAKGIYLLRINNSKTIKVTF